MVVLGFSFLTFRFRGALPLFVLLVGSNRRSRTGEKAITAIVALSRWNRRAQQGRRTLCATGSYVYNYFVWRSAQDAFATGGKA